MITLPNVPSLLTSTVFLATFAVMLVGLISIVIPFLPSIPVIWLGIFLYGVGTNFAVVDANFMLLISLLAFATVFLDYTTTVWGLKKYRGSFWGIVGAALGGFVGSIWGIFGAFVIGPIFGSIVFEMLRGRDNVYGVETERFTIVGFIGGTIVKFSVGVAMIGLFLWKLISG
ncbi:MAG: DUF456 domain-containing protein [Candidatus Kerfeldbacteria bacterium]|nr:DUF456 domain-containing protein [Candidatus Kerfeldbacteria bacterium]